MILLKHLCLELLEYSSPLLVSSFRVEVVQYVIHQGEQVTLTGYLLSLLVIGR